MTAYAFKAPLWQRLLVVVSTIPITIFMNGFRIGVTGVLVAAYGPEHAEGALHFFEGWVVFLMCLAALALVVSAFCFFRKPKLHPLDAISSPDFKPIAPSQNSNTPKWIYASLIGLTVVTIGASQSLHDRLVDRARASAICDLAARA